MVGALSELVHHHPQGGGLDRATAQERGVYTNNKLTLWKPNNKKNNIMELLLPVKIMINKSGIRNSDGDSLLHYIEILIKYQGFVVVNIEFIFWVTHDFFH